jgi:hypothetical protein
MTYTTSVKHFKPSCLNHLQPTALAKSGSTHCSEFLIFNLYFISYKLFSLCMII